jgi:hypothetical protein
VRRLFLACVVAAAALAAFTSQGVGQPSRSTSRAGLPPGIGALDVLLRPPDLPGYGFSGGSPLAALSELRCDKIDPANPQPELARFLKLNSPAGCIALYQRLYKVPGGKPEPAFLGTGAIRFGSLAAAEEGLALSPQLLSHLLLDEAAEEVQPPATIGDATRLFHWRHSEIFSEEEEDCSFLFWRSGSTLSAIFVPGPSPAVNDRIATELAERQQRHVEAPVATKPSEFDDSEVPLENPSLKVPVYWLGRRFDPGRGLHRLHLEGSWSNTRRSVRNPQAGLVYTDSFRFEHTETLALELFTHRQWRRLRREGAELPGSLRCSSSRALNVPRGRAVIASGYEHGFLERKARPCQKGQPKLFVARVSLPKVIVVAQTRLYCSPGCLPRGKGVYDSWKGMAEIARSLVLRPRPAS